MNRQVQALLLSAVRVMGPSAPHPVTAGSAPTAAMAEDQDVVEQVKSACLTTFKRIASASLEPETPPLLPVPLATASGAAASKGADK